MTVIFLLLIIRAIGSVQATLDRQPYLALSSIHSMSSAEGSDSSGSFLAGLLAQADLVGDQDGGVAYDTWSRVTVGS